MKLLTQLLVIVLAIFLSSNSYAQTKSVTKSKSKVIMIKTVTDDDGNSTTEKIIKISESPDEIEVDGIKVTTNDAGETIVLMDGKEIGSDKVKLIKLDVDATEKDGQKTIKIVKVNDDNEPEIIEWSGEGDIPEHLKEKLKSLDIEILDGSGKIIHFDSDQLDALKNSGHKVIVIENEDVEITED